MAHNIHVQYDGGVDSLQNGVKAIKMVDENGEEYWYYPEGENSNQIVNDFIEGKCRSVKHKSVSRIADYVFYSYYSLIYVDFPVCSYIGRSAFGDCDSLTSVSFPVCEYIGDAAFDDCDSLISVSFPVCSYIGEGAFYGCNKLTSVSFPACSYIDNGAFEYCTSLTSVSFPVCSYIGSSAFYGCSSLRSIYLIGSIVCNLANIDAFFGTLIGNGGGSIFVPSHFVSVYKSATNWSYYADLFTTYELE